jgi:hypothetical protein
MTRRRILALGIAVTLTGAAGLVVLMAQPSERDAALRAKMEKTRTGMTEEEVEEIMRDETPVRVSAPKKYKARGWRGDRMTAYVLFDESGVVIDSSWYRHDPSWENRIRKWLSR